MTTLKLLLLTVMLVFPISGEQAYEPSPKLTVLKSVLLPGWGEHSHNSNSRGYVFNSVEATLWIFASVAYTAVIGHENDLFYFAAEHGQITDPQNKSDVFLDRVSKYDSMEEYNEQMQRNRQWDRVYTEENGEYWNWSSSEQRLEYFSIKTDRYLWRQRLTYAFGAIALNHLVSTMDVLYLKKRQAALQVMPEFDNSSTGVSLRLTF